MSKKRHQFFGLRYPAPLDRPVFLDELGAQLVIKSVVFSGNGIEVEVPLPGESNAQAEVVAGGLAIPRRKVCVSASVEEWVALLQATDDPHLFEVDESGAVKAAHRKSQRAVGAAIQWQVYRRDDYRCMLCRRSGGEDGCTLSVDHFIPVEKGGTDEMRNLLTLCRRCNKDKGSRDPKEFFGEDLYWKLKRRMEKGLTP